MVSVCLASHNGEKYIIEQVLSILKQLAPEDELIISDDGSTDQTIHLLGKVNDKRLKLITFSQPALKRCNGERFYYATRNFENALKNAKGDYIFLSDQDDIWYKDKVAKCLAELKKYDVVLTNMTVIDEKGNIKIEKFYRKKPVSRNLWGNFIKFKMQGSCMAFTKKILQKALPFPKNLMLHDGWLYMIGAKHSTPFYLDEPLIYYRRSSDNVSSTTENSSNKILFRMQYRLKFLLQFIKYTRH